MSLYDRLFKPRRYTLPNGTVVEEKRSRAPLVILIVVALGALSVHITGFNFAVLVKKGSKFFDILTAMFPPNTGYLAKIWQPLWDTIKMSFLGSFVGAVLAIPFAIAAETLWRYQSFPTVSREPHSERKAEIYVRVKSSAY